MHVKRPWNRGSITAGEKDFSPSWNDQACSEAHPASCKMGTGRSSPWGKAAATWVWPPVSSQGRQKDSMEPYLNLVANSVGGT